MRQGGLGTHEVLAGQISSLRFSQSPSSSGPERLRFVYRLIYRIRRKKSEGGKET